MIDLTLSSQARIRLVLVLVGNIVSGLELPFFALFIIMMVIGGQVFLGNLYQSLFTPGWFFGYSPFALLAIGFSILLAVSPFIIGSFLFVQLRLGNHPLVRYGRGLFLDSLFVAGVLMLVLFSFPFSFIVYELLHPYPHTLVSV